jgi:hypothetical protein
VWEDSLFDYHPEMYPSVNLSTPVSYTQRENQFQFATASYDVLSPPPQLHAPTRRYSVVESQSRDYCDRSYKSEPLPGKIFYRKWFLWRMNV